MQARCFVSMARHSHEDDIFTSATTSMRVTTSVSKQTVVKVEIVGFSLLSVLDYHHCGYMQTIMIVAIISDGNEQNAMRDL